MSEEEAATRAVKLKIHYTFDAEHKNDHLTKPPQSYDVQTAPIDETTTIGIIDLRTCLQAINTSSPELISHLDTDFTVYAYDYSEPNTPLVGQGLLSKIWAQDGPVDAESEAMVTGRLTKNPLSAFNKNAQPFLEVKLRLTPVASANPRARSGSVSSASAEPPVWLASQGPVGDMQRPQSPASFERLEAMQRMLSEGGPRRESFYGDHGSMSRPSSRPGTPTQLPQYNLPQLSQPSGAQARPPQQNEYSYNMHGRRDSFSGYYSGDELQDEGPARKRARIAKVTKLTKNDFNIEQQPSSLRGAAIMSSSVRTHKPVAINPTVALQQGLSAEEPVRPPTPIPQPNNKTGRPRGRPRKREYPNLEKGRKPRASSPSLQQSHNDSHSVAADMSSPEDTRDNARNHSNNSTPQNIPSSPPVMPDHPSLVTSPQLPAMPHHEDSGFMSGNLDEIFGNPQQFEFSEYLVENTKGYGPEPGTEAEAPNDQNGFYPAVFEDDSAVEGPTPQPDTMTLPTPSLQVSSQYLQPTRTQSQPPRLSNKELHALEGNASNKMGAPTLLPRPPAPSDLQRSYSVTPQVPASDPAPRHFQRSNTWAPDMSDAIMSDATGPLDPNKPKGRKRVGKEQTKARLDSAIEKGEMPPFCVNCGTIDTPAWRRGWVKVFTCPWDAIPESAQPGEMCYKEAAEFHHDGTIKVWKGYKVDRLPGDRDPAWSPVCLCNPCGLWFHKTRKMRPPEKWQKKGSDDKKKRKRKRPPKPPKSRTNPPRVAAGNLQSDVQEPPSEDSSPADTSAEDGADDNGDDYANFGDDSQEIDLELPTMPTRPASAVPLTRHLNLSENGPLRQVQSSPIAYNAQEADSTPSRSVRRLLFPSPVTNKAASIKPLSEEQNEVLLPSFVRRSPRLQKTRDIFNEIGAVAITVDGEGKENATPNQIGLDNLFGENDGATLMLPPTTPTPKRRSERILAKTPGETPQREFGTEISANAQISPGFGRTPGGGLDLAQFFLETAQKKLDPSMMTPHSRSLHEACSGRSNKTPKSQTQVTPRKTSGRVVEFNFPDLPSLNGSSPLSSDRHQVATSELPTDVIFSEYETYLNMDPNTDGPMPSSPPTGMHVDINFSEFFNAGDVDSELDVHMWESFTETAPKTPQKRKSPGGKFESLEVPPTPGSGLRRSPRLRSGDATQE